jgi:4-hydroxybutyrate CoA-transferase
VNPAARSKWREHYESRLVSAAEAVAHIQDGDRIWIPPQQNPEVLGIALANRAAELNNVTLEAILLDDYWWSFPGVGDNLAIKILQAADKSRDAVNTHRADFIPWWVYLANKAADEGRPGARQIDVTMVSVSPPNEQGYCCFGNILWDAKQACQTARLALAEVNDALPRTFGDGWIHVSEIDYFVEHSHSPTFFAYGDPQPADRAIADHVAELLRDGDTIQVGTGRTTAALLTLGIFGNFRDLGWFTEMTLDGVIDLAEQGVITCERVRTNPGQLVATGYNGSRDLEVIADNPRYLLKPVSYIHNPCTIASNDNAVAINSAVHVDLTGQIAAGAHGPKIWSGTGGQLAFAFGALMSKGGRSIVVMPSTAKGGTVSRITAELPAGQLITVPRELADIVVTEFGVAQLLNRSERDRARELIAIAHPDHRADLARAAAGLYGL